MIDFNLKEGDALITNDIELVLLQIDILFDTVPNDILGYSDYGTKYDKFLFNLQLSNEDIKTEIMNDLRSIDLLGYIPTVDVIILNGTQSDIILVEITLSRGYSGYKKTYKIS